MNPHKKNIELTGSLIYPIEVGEAAFIREATVCAEQVPSCGPRRSLHRKFALKLSIPTTACM